MCISTRKLQRMLPACIGASCTLAHDADFTEYSCHESSSMGPVVLSDRLHALRLQRCVNHTSLLNTDPLRALLQEPQHHMAATEGIWTRHAALQALG
jgi:hypothetical protein